MEELLGLALFAFVAVFGWLIADLKYTHSTFTHSMEEIEEEELLDAERRAEGYREMSIKDIISKNSTNGFDAV